MDNLFSRSSVSLFFRFDGKTTNFWGIESKLKFSVLLVLLLLDFQYGDVFLSEGRSGDTGALELMKLFLVGDSSRVRSFLKPTISASRFATLIFSFSSSRASDSRSSSPLLLFVESFLNIARNCTSFLKSSSFDDPEEVASFGIGGGTFLEEDGIGGGNSVVVSMEDNPGGRICGGSGGGGGGGKPGFLTLFFFSFVIFNPEQYLCSRRVFVFSSFYVTIESVY